MFDFTEITPQPPTLDDLRAYVEGHRESLLDASELLGGQAGLRLALAAMVDLADAGAPSRRTMRSLDGLLDLLMLEHVHDPERIEAARFASINPASPVVEEICLLADGLDEALAAVRAELDARTSGLRVQVAA